MKRHPIDLFSLITGLGFGAVAISVLTDLTWFGTGPWSGQWIGPILLIVLGLLVLAPKRTAPIAEPVPTTDAGYTDDGHEELPAAFTDL